MLLLEWGSSYRLTDTFSSLAEITLSHRPPIAPPPAPPLLFSNIKACVDATCSVNNSPWVFTAASQEYSQQSPGLSSLLPTPPPQLVRAPCSAVYALHVCSNVPSMSCTTNTRLQVAVIGRSSRSRRSWSDVLIYRYCIVRLQKLLARCSSLGAVQPVYCNTMNFLANSVLHRRLCDGWIRKAKIDDDPSMDCHVTVLEPHKIRSLRNRNFNKVRTQSSSKTSRYTDNWERRSLLAAKR